MAAGRVASAYSDRRLTTPSDRSEVCSPTCRRPFVGVALQEPYHYPSCSEQHSSLASHTPYPRLYCDTRNPNMTTRTSPARALAAELDRRLCPGRLLTGPDYDDSRRVWNGAIDHAPALIVRPHAPTEVQATVLAAQHHRVPLSVRGGGHDWVGRSLRHDGLVIDLSAMNRVAVDPQTQLAALQGGATTGDVIKAAQAHRLSAATGTVGAVGMAGMALRGGYGPMIGRYGLALDNLVSAEVVLADGRCVTATPSREPELYWALRGGGGNFGVVTSLSVQLHPVAEVLAGLILYPWHQAAHAWAELNDILATAPDELTVQSGILCGPDGGPTLFLSPVWCGDLAAGETPLQPLRHL